MIPPRVDSPAIQEPFSSATTLEQPLEALTWAHCSPIAHQTSLLASKSMRIQALYSTVPHCPAFKQHVCPVCYSLNVRAPLPTIWDYPRCKGPTHVRANNALCYRCFPPHVTGARTEYSVCNSLHFLFTLAINPIHSTFCMQRAIQGTPTDPISSSCSL
jgi:hypothetical protein